MSFRVLDGAKVNETAALLTKRITERFSTASLINVSKEVEAICREANRRASWMARPILWIRIPALLLAISIVLFLVHTLTRLEIKLYPDTLSDLTQMVEAAINDFILIGAALFFLGTVEIRIKRNRALAALHELRSLAHIIDLHQLTKDPSKIRDNIALTSSSPHPELDAYHLSRYLDYCSELLSLIGKVAAIYAQHCSDSVVLAAVDEVETLTNGIGRKIWQKIMIVLASPQFAA